MRFFGHQIMRKTDGAAAIGQDHHEKFLDHSVRIDYGRMVSDADQGGSDPTGMSVGDQYIVNNWATQTDGHVVEWDGSAWLDHSATMGTGKRVRVASSGVSGSFAGKANYIMEKTAGGWDELAPSGLHDGLQCIITGPPASYWYLDAFAWDNGASAWVQISEELSVESGDNALQISSGEISHLETMGHGQTVDYFLVVGSSATTPSANAMESWIATADWGTPSTAVGDVMYYDGQTWTKIGAVSAGDKFGITPGSPFNDAAGCFAGHNSDLAEYNSGDVGSAGSYTFTEPHVGDSAYSGETPMGGHVSVWEETTAVWDGSAWRLNAQSPSTLDGDGLTWAESDRTLAVKPKTGAGLSIDNAELAVVAQTSAGQDQQPTASDQVVTRSYVQAYVTGLSWKTPASVLEAIGTADSQPGNPSAGDAYIVGTSWGGFATGDLVEYDGTTWQLIAANDGGNPETDLRVVVSASPTGGDIFAGNANANAKWNGTAWEFDDAADGDVVPITDGYYAETTWIFSGTAWEKFSNNTYTAGYGLNLSGGQFSFDLKTAGPTVQSSGTTWDTGLGSTVDGDKLMIFRNGVLQRKVSSLTTDGEYTWSGGTATFYTTFDGAGEVVYAWGPGV